MDGGDISDQSSTSAAADNNIGLGNQFSDSKEIRNQANPSTVFMSGSDPSVIDTSFSEKCVPCNRVADETERNGSDAQNELLPRNPDDLDSHFPISPPTSTSSRSDTVPTKTLSRVESDTIPRSYRRVRRSYSSVSSETTCKKCDDDPDCKHKPVFGGSIESQKTSLGRHMREEHSGRQDWSYQCLLDNDGSACAKTIKLARNRRKHTEAVHPAESKELPPTDKSTRTANARTNALLDSWYAKVPRKSKP